MNRHILFVTTDNVNPLCGGIDRITYLLASEFNKRGYTSTSAYLKKKNPNRPSDSVFTDEILLEEGDHSRQLAAIFEKYQIDFIIAQGVNTLMNQEMVYLREAIDDQARQIRLFFVFHQMPGHELNTLDGHVLVKKIFSKEWRHYLKQLLIQILLPVDRHILRKILSPKYNVPYQTADKIVLLSAAYIEDFNRLAGGDDTSKYAAIPNMLTYSIGEEAQLSKTREVLMVARMEEYAKRIKLAIRIWNKLPQEILDEGWKLVIVGDGEDLAYYKKYVDSKHIRNIQFMGQQNPLQYYHRASVFMMTSAFEGWPMTLMEAMQNECVPIVFDSFKAVYDIIESGKDGVIVSEGEVDEYVAQLVRLMQENEMREKMAKQGLLSCQRFSQECITKKWLDLFDQIG